MFLNLAIVTIPVLIFQLTLFAIGVGLSVAASFLLKPKAKSSPVQLDNEPTATASRGAILPYLIGRRRVGAVFAEVHERRFLSTGKSRRGKGGGGGGSGPSPIYTEKGTHLLCVGPAKRLHRIWQNGKIYWEGPIDPSTHPNGTFVTINVPGSSIPDRFRVSWGQLDGSANAPYPLVCFIFWEKNLGPSPHWPLLEYDLETEIQHSEPLTHSDPTITIDTPTADDPTHTDTGVNPAHAIYQLLFARFPYGLNIAAEWGDVIDLNCLEYLGQVLATEGLPISVYAPNGQTVQATLASILQDIGAVMPWDPVIGKFRFKLIRPGADTATEIEEALVTDPLPQTENLIFAKPTDKITFAFADKDRNFKTATVSVDDDGQAVYQDYQKATQTEMRSIIFFKVAQQVAERRSQEVLARATKYALYANRGARRLFPGQVITVPSVTSDILRVVEVGVSPNSGKVTVTCLSDFYGAAVASEALTGVPPSGNSQTFATDPDLAFAILEVPAHVLRGQPETIVVPRIRATTDMVTAELLLSRDDVTYQDEGTESDVQTGGTLLSALTPTDAWEIAQGPTFTAEGPDIGTVLDLSSNDSEWRSGRQVVLIDDELFFLRKVTAMGSGVYRLDGLLRARYDTERAAHAIGARAYIFQMSAIREVQDIILQPNTLVYVKTEPAGLGGVVDPADVTAVSRTLVGKGVTPMPVSALRTVDQRSTYRTTEDVLLKWAYKSAAIPHTGAGLQGAGSAVGASPIVGSFELKFYDLSMVLKATKTSPTADYSYLNLDLLADFGTEQSFIVEVRNVNGGWKSAARTLTVNLV